jgi:hypothetical protein
MSNNRIYYAIQQVELGTASTKTAAHGVQTVGLTTNFNLEQVFELGQLAIYQNVEGIPEIEVTINKVLDGYPLVYVLATEKGSEIANDLVATGPDLPGRQNARVDMRLSIYPDTVVSANGNPVAGGVVKCKGMYVSSVTYTFPVDGNFTEDVTLVGNEKIWADTGTTGQFTNNDDVPNAATGVNRRQHLDMSASRFPVEIPGIGSDGSNGTAGDGVGFDVHFQNITVSVDLGREAINELGSFAPYHRYVTFPVSVTSEFTVLATTGDGINASEEGYYTAANINNVSDATVATGNESACTPRFNLRDQKIFLQTCEGTKVYLGEKNKLTSVNYSGGDTGGGNVNVTYSYQTFNDFVVAHSGGNFYSSVGENGYSTGTTAAPTTAAPQSVSKAVPVKLAGSEDVK